MMKLFSYFDQDRLEKAFYIMPEAFTKNSRREVLSYALGATLYMPATRPNIHQDLLTKKHAGLTSMVICLEDAIGDGEVAYAETRFIEELELLQDDLEKGYLHQDDLPLLFVRIRNYDQLITLMQKTDKIWPLLTGIVMPKFSAEDGERILAAITQLNQQGNHQLYAMPILETKAVIYKETRISELLSIKKVLDQYRELILNVRIGATDFCGLYGIRRNSDTTVYDIAMMRDCITDIINIFLRADEPYVVSGPVWEHFSSKERLLKPLLRQTPFREKYGEKGLELRMELIDQQMDGLIREIMMDIANGLTGKTIIHPTHIKPVQTLNTVTYEEYADALAIVKQTDGSTGVIKSSFQNKMNEIKPHLYWAEKTLLKSKIYGVLHEDYTHIDLLQSEIHDQYTRSIKN